MLKILAHGIPSRMSLSPDGRFVAYDSPSPEDASRDIFLLATDGSLDLPLVEHPADDAVIGWAPDGTSLLFASDRTGTKGIWRLAISDGKPQGAAELVKREMGAWSPLGLTRNGSLFYATQSGMMDVYTAPLDPATGQVLAPPQPANPRLGGSNSSPAWSPDGRYLAYLSPERHALRINEQRSRVVSIRAVEGGETREFPLKLLAIGQPHWSPDGRFLLAAGWDEGVRPGAYRIDAQTGNAAAMAETANFIWRAVWAPDGLAIFYARGEEAARNSYILRMREIATGREEERYRGGIIRTLAISPDGRQVALTEEEERLRHTTLKVIPAAGGEPRELLRVESPAAVASLAWMPDGRHLLFVRENTVWRVPVAGGEAQRVGLAMDRIRDLRVHPDGRQIAFTAGSAAVEVWVMENFLPATLTAKPRAPRR
jgi:Tol biopolymer transport system component